MSDWIVAGARQQVAKMLILLILVALMAGAFIASVLWFFLG